jgi:hypothetical protein
MRITKQEVKGDGREGRREDHGQMDSTVMVVEGDEGGDQKRGQM